MPLNVTVAAAAAAALAPVLRRSTLSLAEAPNEAAWRAAVAKRGWHAMYVAPSMVSASGVGGALAKLFSEDAGGRLLVARVNSVRPLIYEAPPFNVAIANYFKSLGDNQAKMTGDLVELPEKLPNVVPDIGKWILYGALVLGGFYLLGQSARAPRVSIGGGR